MKSIHRFLMLFAVCVIGLPLLATLGCAEGPLWRTGYLSPWARQQWEDEEQIAATLISKKQQLRDMVDNAIATGPGEMESASQALSKIVANDPVMLLRIEAVRLLPELRTEASASALQLAAKDRDVEVRRAAVRSLELYGGDFAGQTLAQMAQQDSDIDVQISATSALGRFEGSSVIKSLAKIINNPNPSLQLRAAESLATVTGKEFGNDIQAWQEYLQTSLASDFNSTEVLTTDKSDEHPTFR